MNFTSLKCSHTSPYYVYFQLFNYTKLILYNISIIYYTNTYCPPWGAGVSQYFQRKLYKVDGILLMGPKLWKQFFITLIHIVLLEGQVFLSIFNPNYTKLMGYIVDGTKIMRETLIHIVLLEGQVGQHCAQLQWSESTLLA